MADAKNDIKLYLEKALVRENLKNISVDILGNSEKGDGFIGDIVFVTVTGTNTNSNQQKNLNLVLKCSKKSQALRNSVPIKEVFHKEILIYNTILPEFQQFQRSKSIQNIFDSFPKYYGHFTNETTEIIVLENLKKIGYELWDQRKPLTKKHLFMVLEKYGEFHAISAAMRVQKPEKFNELCEKLKNLYTKFDDGSLEVLLSSIVGEVHDLLLNDSYNKEILDKLNKFKCEIPFIYNKMLEECNEDFKIISHGDCWNNNFMWKHNEQDKISPEKVSIIDWQVSTLTSPISDLSYFIFCSISQNELNDFNTVLDTYYNSFCQTLKQLGNNPEEIYTKKQFLADWHKYGKFGFGLSLLINKLGFTKKEDLPDLSKSANNGESFDKSLTFSVNDNEGYKQRIKPLVEFVVKCQLID